KLSAREVSSYWTGRAMEFVRSQPGAWLALIGHKLALTFSAREAPDSESMEVFADESWILRRLRALGFGSLCGLVVLGTFAMRLEWRRMWWLYAVAATYALSVASFYVFARYRFPLAIALMPIAAAARADLPERWRWRVPALLIAVVALTYLPDVNTKAGRAI